VHVFGVSRTLETKVCEKTMSPEWNQEFSLPVPCDVPLAYNRFDLRLWDKNSVFSKDEEVGRLFFKVSDVLSAPPERLGPFWANLYVSQRDDSSLSVLRSGADTLMPPLLCTARYKDPDGCAPTFRGRLLLEFTVTVCKLLPLSSAFALSLT
jgi:hypothetical protein